MRTIKSLEKKLEKIKSELLGIEEMHPGSISKQFNICGNPNCKCKDKVDPKKHGPYYQLSFVHKGRSSSRFIKKECLAEIKLQTQNYKRFKKLVDEWKILATDLSQEKLKIKLSAASKT